MWDLWDWNWDQGLKISLFIFENTDNKKIGIIATKSSLNVNQEGEFDTQTCHMDIRLAPQIVELIHLKVEKYSYEGPMDTINNISKGVEEDSKLRVTVSIQRRLFSLVIPTVILNIIGHMSNHYKPGHFVAKYERES